MSDSMSIGVVMITVDRRILGGTTNYLHDTLECIARADLVDCSEVDKLYVVDSGSGLWAHSVLKSIPALHLSGKCSTITRGETVCANINVCDALEVGADYDWCIFLEDDILVHSNFFTKARDWIHEHQREDRRVYSLAHPYSVDEVRSLGWAPGDECWDYPIEDFYGTQCVALRGSDAKSVSEYIRSNVYTRADNGTAYDLLISDWSLETYPAIKHFLGCMPSMSRHIGSESIIRPRTDVHTCVSFA